MIERVDFYLLKDDTAAGGTTVPRLACRIVEKAYRLGLKIYVRVNSIAQAQQFDELLWTFSQNSFVPHALFDGDDAEAREQPILIGAGDGPKWIDDLLISLTGQIADDHQRYRRIADFVGNSDDDKAAGRARFKHYRELGLEPHTHPM